MIPSLDTRLANAVTEINDALLSYEERINQIAEKFREETIIPFCDRYNYNFMSGNGTFFFIDQRKEIKDFEFNGCQGCDIIKTLETVVACESGYHEFGMYISDY